jgi:hypothetical protein
MTIVTSVLRRVRCRPLLLLLLPVSTGLTQQVPDSGFAPPISRPAYAQGRGPVVAIDEAHHNFHTATGRYFAFARLVERDGYVVKRGRSRFTPAALDSVSILVISNALSDSTAEWHLPTAPAFTASEVAAVRDWVAAGGALLLIADHMPMAGAADSLARAFGVHFIDGFAIDDKTGGIFDHVRTASDSGLGSLASHAITNGRNGAERVERVRVFTGQAFRVTAQAAPLLTITGASILMFLPDTAWQVGPRTPRSSAQGLLQGAVLRHGRGRVAVFGEAAMFSAQLAGAERRPMGMNDPRAGQNPQFVLNVMHWLSGLIEP